MSKVIFFFAGTGDEARSYASQYELYSPFKEDVIRIYISGCQKKQVGNGSLFPDLDIAANNIRSSFEGVELNLNQLKAHFGGSIYIPNHNSLENKITVEALTLEGFSRGAVTTFAVAKKIDELNIPIHIMSNQPVPGETKLAKTLYHKYCDLRACRNIKSAHIFLASYNLEQGLIHNFFFRQMVAQFAPETKTQTILFPHQHHLNWCYGSPISAHSNRVMAENDFIAPLFKPVYELSIKSWYQSQRSHFFTPHEFMQTIYGAEAPIEKDPFYLDLLLEKASSVLVKNNVNVPSSLTHEQASALLALSNLSEDDETKISLFHFSLQRSKQAAKFVKIVNKVTETCDYLSSVIPNDIRSNKSQKLKLHANEYKKSVFSDSFEFLSKRNPSAEEKTQFADAVYKAECTFRKQALGIERGVMRRILKFLTNFITHITGVALIVNTINKVNTGNWLLFQHNRSVEAVRETRRGFLRDLEEIPEEHYTARGCSPY